MFAAFVFMITDGQDTQKRRRRGIGMHALPPAGTGGRRGLDRNGAGVVDRG
jgi:hypothetical protein